MEVPWQAAWGNRDTDDLHGFSRNWLGGWDQSRGEGARKKIIIEVFLFPWNVRAQIMDSCAPQK